MDIKTLTSVITFVHFSSKFTGIIMTNIFRYYTLTYYTVLLQYVPLVKLSCIFQNTFKMHVDAQAIYIYIPLT